MSSIATLLPAPGSAALSRPRSVVGGARRRDPLAARRSRAPRRGASLAVAASASEVPPEYVALANDLVDTAGAITTKYFRTKLDIDDKNDASPVTIADWSAEAAMRAMVKERFPSHAIFGEEEGIELGAGGEQEWTWVFDPIDGTKSFITGKPLWGTSPRSCTTASPSSASSTSPWNERWAGVAGQTSTLNGEPISVRPCESIGDAYMYATTPLMFEGDNAAPYERVADLVKVPMYGCDCYAYGLPRRGTLRRGGGGGPQTLRLHGVGAHRQGRGGCSTDWKGEELRWQEAPRRSRRVISRVRCASRGTPERTPRPSPRSTRERRCPRRRGRKPTAKGRVSAATASQSQTSASSRQPVSLMSSIDVSRTRDAMTLR